MSEFSDLQQQLKATRGSHSAARLQAKIANEKLREVKRRQLEIGRHQRDGASDQLDLLRREERQIAASLEELRSAEVTRFQELRDREILFEQFSDPRENIGNLDDAFPILMFPIRLETRFMLAGRDDRNSNELWIRVYPDDISVDTFEPVLAEVEQSNARIYWTNIWKAAGDDGERRAAWRSLAKSHGAGRARWIIEQFAPVNADQEPTAAAGDHILVIVSDTPLADAEKPTVATYWRQVFLAPNDQVSLNSAFDELVSELGQQRAETVVESYAPQNLTVKPTNPDQVTNIRIEFLELPVTDSVVTQQQTWSTPANTALQPERYVVMGFNGGQQTLTHIGRAIPSELVIGPNPSASSDEQLRIEDDELVVPDELKWMTDFDEAVKNGMGFRIELSPAQFRLGFDRLFVVGVRMSADAETGKGELEQLVQNHQRSRRGLHILPQGTPTNNVEDEASGYTWVEDGDLSYDHFFDQDHSDDPSDWRTRKDGRWLAELLGIDPEVMKFSPNYFATDQCEARAMNQALWPATLGYFMQQMMDPVFSKETIKSTRSYFNRYVLGRGALPAIRIGRQPYGILPMAPLDRLKWVNRKTLNPKTFLSGVPNQQIFLPRLYSLLLKADESWSRMAEAVSFVGKPGVDPQQALLDVIGLHPTSVEFYQRYGESYEQMYNRFKLAGPGAESKAANAALQYFLDGMQLLGEFGVAAIEPGQVPEILNKYFLRDPGLLKGPVIDDPVLSEINPVQPSQENGDNYIEWLISAVMDSHDTLRKQGGFIDDRPPTALLYQMLRHALDLGFVETSINLHEQLNVLSFEQAQEARREPKFFHIQEAEDEKGSPWQYLYKTEAAITGNHNIRIAEFIPQILTTRDPYLNKQLQALEHLKEVPTAKLERAFTEHIDCCSYRLDSWQLGLLNVQLAHMRSSPKVERGEINDIDESEGREAERTTNAGLYLGAYGWAEDLRPDNRQITPVELPEELNAIFNKPGQSAVGTDRKNFGYIHAPSLDHAVTAAVLRNGYLSNATQQDPESLSINLTSERVRLAMGVIEGVRNGQSLGALLGYHLERSLHDQTDLFLDAIIYELRKQFPLRANRFSTTRTGSDVSIEAIEARNVVDGLALVEHVQEQTPANKQYPFGLGSDLPSVTDANQLAAINKSVSQIMNINDAVADLAMAESVYQVVRGNYDRAGSSLEAYSKGNFPPIPEVVQTPRKGITLTHRVGVHLRGGVSPDSPEHVSPRAKGEPAINLWLAELLPAMTDIYCMVDFINPLNSASDTMKLTADQLGLQAIDLLYMIKRETEQEMQALDDRIVFHMISSLAIRPNSEIKIRYRDKQPGQFSIFEITPLVADLRDILLRSRPLQATDTRLPNEASKSEDSGQSIRQIKITRVREMLATQQTDLTGFVNDIDLLLGDADQSIVNNNVIENVDTIITEFSTIADRISMFGLPGTGIGFAWDWRRTMFSDLLADGEALLVRWQKNLDKFDARITEYESLPGSTTDEDKVKFLLKTALLISTEFIQPPASGDPEDLKNDLTGSPSSRRATFVNARDAITSVLANNHTVSDLYKELDAQKITIAAHDAEPFDLNQRLRVMVRFAETVQSKATSLLADITTRISESDALLVDDPTANIRGRIESATHAIRKLTSDDFVILPEFEVQALHGAEWQNAYDNRDQLTSFLRTDEAIDFPIDDWLYGVSRVREKVQHLESAIMFTEAFATTSPELVPLQFPHRENDSWLAMKYPEIKPGTEEPFVIDEDKLLYTAHYTSAFDSSAPLHCGVLVDEWTEVIPTTEETTGLAFHYDRPNTEPPQSMLLAMPADFTGEWQWQDLVDSLHSCLEMARKRAVEPQHIDGEDYARFLPAIISSFTRRPWMYSLDFATNNAIHHRLEDF